MRESKLPVWSHIQHYSPMNFDESIITKGAEGFCCQFDTFEDNYDYRLRLVMFLEDTYGKDTFFRVADEAVNRGCDSSYKGDDIQAAKDADTKGLADIIVASTSDNVFERSADWNKKNLPDRVEEYYAYMESIGLQIG